MKTLNAFKKLFLVLSFFSILVTGCSSDDRAESNNPEKRVTFKVIGSSGASISVVVYGIGTSTYPVSGINSSTWTSDEILVPEAATTVTLSANAMGTSVTSSIKLQIFINNELKKEITQSGTVMSTYTQFTF